MFERIENGWALARQSWEVLKLDKELLAFPLLSGLACLLVMASFAVPIWASGLAESFQEGAEGGGEIGQAEQILGYVIIIGALYLYAAEGTVPQQFDNRLFRQAFAHK